MTEGAIAARRLDDRLPFIHREAVGLAIRDVERGWTFDGAPVRGLAIEVALAEIALAADCTRHADERHEKQKKGRIAADAKHTSRKMLLMPRGVKRVARRLRRRVEGVPGVRAAFDGL